MGTKTISIDEDAYNRLKSQKKGKESFSDVIKRILSPTDSSDNIMNYAGLWKNLSDTEFEKIETILHEISGDFDDMFG